MVFPHDVIIAVLRASGSIIPDNDEMMDRTGQDRPDRTEQDQLSYLPVSTLS